MSEAVIEKRDPVKATIDRLVSMGCDRVPVELVIRAWRETLYPELESRVGARLTIGLSDAQLDEFETLVDADNQDGASQWLTDHVPHYPQIVAEEFDRLIGEAVDWFARRAARPTGGSR
jgi:hypothetical protein